MKPEQIRGGGFAGGTFIGAPNVDISSPLRDLTKSLGIATEGVVKSLTGDYLKGIDDKKQVALDEAAIFEQTTAGYTSEKLRAEIESEPMLAKFKENPYLLPAINVYRGRKQADELALQMVQSGIDVGDPDGVRQFYEENAPDLNDPFYARGFNEQNARLQAQFSQRQLQNAINQVETETIEASSTLFADEFARTGDIGATTAALRASPFGAKLTPKQLNDIQLELAQRLALDGNLTAFDALTTGKRGDAPSLFDSPQTAVDVRRLRAQAENVAHEKTSGQRRAAMDTLETEINAGRLTSNALLNDPRYLSLADPGQGPGEMSAAQKQVKDQYDAAQIRLAEQYARERQAREIQEMVDEVSRNAAQQMAEGKGWMIGNVRIPLPNGGTKVITAAQQTEFAIEGTRKALLGDNPMSYREEDAPQKYKQYFGYLAKNNKEDDLVKRAFGAMTSDLTLDALTEDPTSAVQALTMWRSMSDHQQSRYSTNPRTANIMEMASNYLGDNPMLKPEAALAKAAVRADSGVRSIRSDSKLIEKAAKGLTLMDASGGKSWWGGKGKGVTPDLGQVRGFVSEQITEGLQFGLTEDEAVERANKQAAAMFVQVNGAAVRLPQTPSKSGIIQSPEDWAKDVSVFISGVANAEQVPNEELYLVHNGLDTDTYTLFRRRPSANDTPTVPVFVGNYTAADIGVASAMTKGIAGQTEAAVSKKPGATSAPKQRTGDEAIADRQERRDELNDIVGNFTVPRNKQ